MLDDIGRFPLCPFGEIRTPGECLHADILEFILWITASVIGIIR